MKISAFSFWKRERTHMLGSPLPLIVFVCFSVTLPPSPTDVLFEWPLLEIWFLFWIYNTSKAFFSFRFKTISKENNYLYQWLIQIIVFLSTFRVFNWWERQFGQHAQKLHENYNIVIFVLKQWGYMRETSQCFG